MTVNELIGGNIKSLRKKKGMKQHELAAMIGKHESSIRKYEKGLVDIPNSVIVDISKVLDSSPREIMQVERW